MKNAVMKPPEVSENGNNHNNEYILLVFFFSPIAIICNHHFLTFIFPSSIVKGRLKKKTTGNKNDKINRKNTLPPDFKMTTSRTESSYSTSKSCGTQFGNNIVYIVYIVLTLN